MNKAVEFQKGKPADSPNSQDTTVSGLIANGMAVADKLELGKVYALTGTDGAKELGIDTAYDTTNSVVLFHHIEEFFRMAGEGTKLYLMVVAQSVMPSVMVSDATGIYARKMVAEAKGQIRQIAIAFNPAAGYTETTTDGMNTDIRSAIAPAQEFALWAFETERPLHVFLEGRAFNATGVTALDLKALTVGAGLPLEADKVSLVIGQDFDFADSRAWAFGKKHAAIGNALGVLSSIRVNQNIGEVETLNISNAIKGKFLTAGLSNHTTVEASETMLSALDAKGYIFPISYTGISGYRWNNDHVCAPEIVDEETGIMNESTISYGRAMDDAVRRLRAAFLPKIKSVQPADNETGKLPIGVVKAFNALGDGVFEDMKAEGLISGGVTYTNPNSDLLTGEKALEVEFDLQPTGSINKIKGTINLKKSL